MSAPPRKPRWFRQATVWIPTWRAWLSALVLGVLTLVLVLREAHAFLSVQHPVPANVLVVEGWLSDDALRAAVREFERGGYEWIIAAGGPMPKGYLVSGYATYAAIADDSLAKLGVPADRRVQAPAEKTYRHRTYISAVGVRARLKEMARPVRGINVVSEGPHARRTWATYRKVFGPSTPVGVIALEPNDYDPQRWWAYSDGVKGTLTEGLGWVYEWLFDSGRGGD